MLRTRQCELKRAITVYKTQFKSDSKSYNPETEIAKDIRFKFVAKKPLSELRNIFNGKQESQYIKVGLDIYLMLNFVLILNKNINWIGCNRKQ